MKTTGNYGRYYCFVHETDFEERGPAAKHLVKEHGMTEEQAKAKLDKIDEMYDEMEDFDEDID